MSIGSYFFCGNRIQARFFDILLDFFSLFAIFQIIFYKGYCVLFGKRIPMLLGKLIRKGKTLTPISIRVHKTIIDAKNHSQHSYCQPKPAAQDMFAFLPKNCHLFHLLFGFAAHRWGILKQKIQAPSKCRFTEPHKPNCPQYCGDAKPNQQYDALKMGQDGKQKLLLQKIPCL